MKRLFGGNLRSLLGWRDARADVREEMALHVDLRAAELQARGLSADAARQQARREVGAADVVAPIAAALADVTDRRSSLAQRWDEFRQDVRHALRVFGASPGFSILAVLTIAVGLGANAAIFALVNTLFLRPLPFDPERNLVRVREYREAADGTRNEVDASFRTAEAVARRTDLFSTSVAMVGVHRALVRGDGPLHVQATRVGPGYTGVLGITPVIGRPFTADEERTVAGVALISHRLWQSVFAGSPAVIGERIRLDDQLLEVVGVLPPVMHVPYGSDVWFPSRFSEMQRSVFILARLAPGVSREQAIAGMEPEAVQLNQLYPDLMRGMGITAITAYQHFVNDDDRIAMALMGAVGFLALIGCANVSLLLTTRFASRRREVAVRAALGCGRGRQVRQFVTEAVVLFAAGGIAGLLLATWLQDWLVVFLPRAFATQVGVEGIPLDFTVVTFAAAVAVITGVGFGLIAALRATGADLNAVMKESGRSMAGDRSRGTLRGLAAAEIALALVLLAAAGMMAATFQRLQAQDIGFEPEGLLTVQAGTEAPRYAGGSARVNYVNAMLERLRAMPGVERAAVTTVNPLCCGDWGARGAVDGIPAATQQELPIFQHQLVSDDFFETMRIPIVRGRGFTADDRVGREMVVVVDDRAARRFWPGQDPIGKRVKRGLPQGPEPWMTVVGVVGTVDDVGEYGETWYLPLAQHPTGPSSNLLHFMVRAQNPNALLPAIKSLSAELDPVLALHDSRTMDVVRAERLEQGRVGTFVTLTFAAAGLILASLGLYGVLSFVLAADRREIGVRLALGAPRGRVAGMIVARGLRVAATGLLIGLPLGVAVSMVLVRVFPDARVEFGILTVATAVILAAGLLATAVPALRAMRLDPLEALRTD
jgi:putative ABC transport system permease protein